MKRVLTFFIVLIASIVYAGEFINYEAIEQRSNFIYANYNMDDKWSNDYVYYSGGRIEDGHWRSLQGSTDTLFLFKHNFCPTEFHSVYPPTASPCDAGQEIQYLLDFTIGMNNPDNYHGNIGRIEVAVYPINGGEPRIIPLSVFDTDDASNSSIYDRMFVYLSFYKYGFGDSAFWYFDSQEKVKAEIRVISFGKVELAVDKIKISDEYGYQIVESSEYLNQLKFNLTPILGDDIVISMSDLIHRYPFVNDLLSGEINEYIILLKNGRTKKISPGYSLKPK